MPTNDDINDDVRHTRATARKRTMDYIFFDVLDLTANDNLIQAINDIGCRSIDDIISLQDREIDNMEYIDSNGGPHLVPASKRNLIKALKSWNFHLMIEHSLKKVDWDNKTYITLEFFDDFRVSSYDPDNPIRTIPRSVTTSTPSKTIPSATYQAKTQSLAQEFRRGIKRDKTQYEVLKDEKQWDSWKRQIESTATAHGCENILDPKFIPASVDAVELYDAQQKFMYDVFLSIMKTDRGMHFVRKYSSTKDAQSVWRDYSEYMSTSTKADLEIERLMTCFTNQRLNSNYRGTTTRFILGWLDNIRKYEEMAPNNAHFPGLDFVDSIL